MYSIYYYYNYNPHQHYNSHSFPCLHCHPHSYIRMVQNLIERCLLLRMNRDECVKVLAHYARIQPIVTLIVWKELLKENRDFFQAYFHSISPRPFLSDSSHTLVQRFGRRKQWK